MSPKSKGEWVNEAKKKGQAGKVSKTTGTVSKQRANAQIEQKARKK